MKLANKRNALVSIICILLFLHHSIESQETSIPNFGGGVIQFDQKIEVSSQGKFAVNFVIEPETVPLSSPSSVSLYLHLWDIRNYSAEIVLYKPEPTNTILLGKRLEPIIYPGAFAFSPDEEYLAVHSINGFLLLTLPDLHIIHNIEFASDNSGIFPEEINWSIDGNFVAMNIDTEILVWNIETYNIYRYELGTNPGRIIALQDGWLILRLAGDNRPNLFSVCTTLLDNCVTYSGENAETYSPVLASSNADIIFTPEVIIDVEKPVSCRTQNIIYRVWRRQSLLVYELHTDSLTTQPIIDCSTTKLSRDGKYIANGLHDMNIWDVATSTLTQSVPHDPIEFFANSEYFVTTQFEIYQLGQDNPVDVLSIDSFEEIIFEEDYPSELIDIVLNGNGRWLFIFTSDGSFLLPITYD